MYPLINLSISVSPILIELESTRVTVGSSLEDKVTYPN
jgi:hypothetical protein